MKVASKYKLNGKSYDMKALAAIGAGKNCYHFAYDLNFQAHGKAFKFNSGNLNDRACYVQHDFMPDYENGVILKFDNLADIQPLDIVIIAYINQRVQSRPLVQSHQMICLLNKSFDSAHFAGSNNVYTLKDDVIESAYTLPRTAIQLFSFPLKNTGTVTTGIDGYLKAGDTPFQVFRLPAADAFEFAKNNNWVQEK
ncbi:hypothetical protein [Massilia sp. erpn]|uniref:hypothetical protein n=1 Tax=Massilia sp. erpn TaxID=2738142 RepID=UPI002106868A|nr:hypothetical protein [Massilia sp. erpn]UTY58930.1 hypothetical protein HPQ68_18130 [Massilia sp. erpn]